MTAQESFGANYFETTLSADLGASDLTLNVATTSGLAVPCYVCVDPDVASKREIMLVDSSLTATTLVMSNVNKRYLTGSAAGSGIEHTTGAKVRCSPVFQHLTDMNDRIDLILNISGITAGDLPYVSSVSSGQATYARLAKGTARQVLATNAGATAPEWVASIQSLLTATGDILYASAANTPARLAAGTNGHVLTLAGGVPSWAAVSGSTIGDLLDYQAVRKSADESVTSSTTLQNDDELLLPVGTSQTWLFEFTVFYTGDAAGDIKLGVTVPAGASVDFGFIGVTTGGTQTGDVHMPAGNSSGAAASLATSSTAARSMAVVKGSVATAGTAGNIQLQFAQDTSNGTATTIRSGSFGEARRIA